MKKAQWKLGTECRACVQAREDLQERERKAALECQREAEETRRQSLAEFFERGGFGASLSRWDRRVFGLGSSEDEEPMAARIACMLHSLVRHARTSAVLPALANAEALPAGWMYPAADETTLLTRLLERGWIAVDASAGIEGFSFDDDGKLKSLYLNGVPYRLVTSPKSTLEDLTTVLLSHSTQTHLDGIRREIRELEVFSLYLYINLLLTEEYRYPWVPEAKRADLNEQLARGLGHFSFGQMVCLCWRAADTASSWKERKGLTAAHASSAAVTTLGGKIDYAQDHPDSPLPEYKPLRAHPEPPGLAAARDLLRRLEELKAEQQGCQLYAQHALPCAHCLGMLYGGGEEAEPVRAHSSDLGGKAVAMRPDLATKRAMQGEAELTGA